MAQKKNYLVNAKEKKMFNFLFHILFLVSVSGNYFNLFPCWKEVYCKRWQIWLLTKTFKIKNVESAFNFCLTMKVGEWVMLANEQTVLQDRHDTILKYCEFF